MFEGKLHVHYGQAYVVPTGAVLDDYMEDCFRGQSNGLCGAAAEDRLFLVSGLHTGAVEFAVDVLSAAPPLDDSWDDVVEASLRVDEQGAQLMDWDGKCSDLRMSPGWYRARYHAKNMDVAGEVDTIVGGDTIDSYWLLFWPAPQAPDTVIKQTSTLAAYWHGVARSLPR